MIKKLKTVVTRQPFFIEIEKKIEVCRIYHLAHTANSAQIWWRFLQVYRRQPSNKPQYLFFVSIKNGCLGSIFYEYCGEFFFLSMQARGSCASFVNQKFSVWQEKSLPNSGLHMTFNINFGPSTSRNFYNMKISHCIQVFFMRITRGPLSKLQ